jgi:hypothetical protein
MMFKKFITQIKRVFNYMQYLCIYYKFNTYMYIQIVFMKNRKNSVYVSQKQLSINIKIEYRAIYSNTLVSTFHDVNE